MLRYVMLWCPFNTPASAVATATGVGWGWTVVAFMVSAQWEEVLSPLSSNPALFEDGWRVSESANYVLILKGFQQATGDAGL
jgi:hypothetical protein